MSNGYTSSDSASEAELNQIEDSLALHRSLKSVQINSTGECLGCGEAIPMARLRLIPNANYCVKCQSAAEKNKTRVVCRNTYVP